MFLVLIAFDLEDKVPFEFDFYAHIRAGLFGPLGKGDEDPFGDVFAHLERDCFAPIFGGVGDDAEPVITVLLPEED